MVGDLGRRVMPGGVAISNRSTFDDVIRNLSLNPDLCRGAGLASAEDGVPSSQSGTHRDRSFLLTSLMTQRVLTWWG